MTKTEERLALVWAAGSAVDCYVPKNYDVAE
jgi:hypothetical protein